LPSGKIIRYLCPPIKGNQKQPAGLRICLFIGTPCYNNFKMSSWQPVRWWSLTLNGTITRKVPWSTTSGFVRASCWSAFGPLKCVLFKLNSSTTYRQDEDVKMSQQKSLAKIQCLVPSTSLSWEIYGSLVYSILSSCHTWDGFLQTWKKFWQTVNAWHFF